MNAFLNNPAKSKWFVAFVRHIPPGQLVRYLAVGVWNTAFGYVSYVAFTILLSRSIPHSYIAASVLSGLLNITVSFLGYKWFVFKTKGSYLKEWLRCLAVYSSSLLFSLAALPILVFFIRRVNGYEQAAPYIAGAILTGIGVVLSFFGHKHISFRSENEVNA